MNDFVLIIFLLTETPDNDAAEHVTSRWCSRKVELEKVLLKEAKY